MLIFSQDYVNLSYLLIFKSTSDISNSKHVTEIFISMRTDKGSCEDVSIRHPYLIALQYKTIYKSNN